MNKELLQLNKKLVRELERKTKHFKEKEKDLEKKSKEAEDILHITFEDKLKKNEKEWNLEWVCLYFDIYGQLVPF